MSSKGNAVVDYICVPHDTFEQCLYFKVITSRSLVEDADLFGLLNERSKIPDHSILLTEFGIHDTTCQSPPSSSATCSTKPYKLNAIPVDFLSSDISKLALQLVIQRIESARETQNEDVLSCLSIDTISSKTDNGKLYLLMNNYPRKTAKYLISSLERRKHFLYSSNVR